MHDVLRTPLTENLRVMNLASPATITSDDTRKRHGLGLNQDAFQFNAPSKPAGSPATKLERRRGHHHKHSLSHQFFLPPTQRAPLSLPASLPIPDWREIMRSSTADQRMQLFWAAFHLFVGFAVMKCNSSSLAASSLSKCITFDAFGIASSTVFEILDNFPVWKTSSVKHPFGLKRAEVVVRFAAAVFLTYSGVELVREVVERLVIGGGHGHGPTDSIHLDPHSLSNDFMPISMIATVFITLFAAVVFGNHAQLSSALELDELPKALQNPFYIITLVPAGIVLCISLSGYHLHAAIDRSLAAIIAGSLITIGILLIYRLGSILCMTYPSKAVKGFYEQVEADDSVVSLEGKVWQVWSGLVVVSLRCEVRGGESGEQRLRERIVRYTRDILGGGYGSGKALKFEVRVECVRL